MLWDCCRNPEGRVLVVTTVRDLRASSRPLLRAVLSRIETSAIGYRLARGAFWSIVGAVLSRGLMLAASIVVARMLGKTGYGELGMVQSTVGMFGVFAGFGLGMTATKYVAEFRHSDPARAGRIISLAWFVAIVTGGLMAICLFLFAPWLAEHAISASHLSGMLRISSLVLLLSALNGAQTGALSGFEAFRMIAFVNFLVGLLSFPILIGGAWVGGLTGAVWALLFNLSINWFLNHLALRREARRYGIFLSCKNCRREFTVLWQFSLPAVLSNAMVMPANWLCRAMLVNQPGGYGEMGVFSAAEQWYGVMLFLPYLLGQVLLPILSEGLGQDRRIESVRLLVLTMKVNALLIVPVVAVASAASRHIMNLYGEGLGENWPTLVVVLFTAGLVAIQSPTAQAIAASGRMWVGCAMNVGWAVVFIVGTVLLVHRGSVGLALARLAGYAIHSVWVFAFAFHFLRGGKKHSRPCREDAALLVSRGSEL